MTRYSKVRAKVVETRRKPELQALVRENVEAGSNLYSDALKSYDGLGGDFEHQVIDHAVEYVNGCVYFRTTVKSSQANGLGDFDVLRTGVKYGVMKISPGEVKSVRGVGVGFFGQSGDRLSGEFLQAGKC